MGALTKVKLSDGSTTEVIAFNDKADCGGIMLDEDTKEVRAVSFNYARTERTFFDDELKGHFDRLEGVGPDKAEVSLVSKTRDEATWVVSFRRDDGPTEYSLYDTASHKPTPLVLCVHGGPWARDFWGFNSAAQWFANRGYACLQVNYRGSSGYGKSFLHKGDKEWGVGAMQHA